jgi:hypothetical protein
MDHVARAEAAVRLIHRAFNDVVIDGDAGEGEQQIPCVGSSVGIARITALVSSIRRSADLTHSVSACGRVDSRLSRAHALQLTLHDGAYSRVLRPDELFMT